MSKKAKHEGSTVPPFDGSGHDWAHQGLVTSRCGSVITVGGHTEVLNGDEPAMAMGDLVRLTVTCDASGAICKRWDVISSRADRRARLVEAFDSLARSMMAWSGTSLRAAITDLRDAIVSEVFEEFIPR